MLSMKILLLADEESKYYWDYFEKEKLEGIDLIISCGDLAPQYLSFLATFAKVPVLYIKGNHDYCYDDTPPEGCICIDDDIYVHNGVRIMGLGGCMSYDYGPLQFTEKEMRKRYKKLRYKIWRNKGIDILVTHAPAYHMNDSKDLPHTGFKVFLEIIDKHNPRLYAHGHVHINYGRDFKRVTEHNSTVIINAYEKYIIEI